MGPAQPVLTSRWALEGTPLDACRVDARIHFVLTAPLELPAALARDAAFWSFYNDYYTAPTADAATVVEQKIVDAIRAALLASDVAALLPSVSIEQGGQTARGPIVVCGDIVTPSVLTRPTLLTVASFDTNGANCSASVYASGKKLYVTQPSDGWFNSDEFKPHTAIHQFSISSTTPKYVATGVVDGWIRNALSLSEQDGNLRVATNTTAWRKGTTTQPNDLFVLRENGSGVLMQRGAVRAYSARAVMS